MIYVLMYIIMAQSAQSLEQVPVGATPAVQVFPSAEACRAAGELGEGAIPVDQGYLWRRHACEAVY